MILKKYRAELFHALHFVVPVIKVCPTVVTIHDAIHFVYPQDLQSWKGRMYAKAMMTAAAHVADRILTVSEYSKSDIVRYLHVNQDKVTVTYALLDKRFTSVSDATSVQRMRQKLGITEDFLLYAGIFKARKNHGALLDAFALLRQQGKRVKLVIAGPLGDGVKVLRRRAVDLGISEHVVFTGFVPDEDLPALYSTATVYACPSLYEGFGQTLIEAMACGTPVVSYNDTSLPEVCGDAALLVDANDAPAFAAQIRRLLEDAKLRTALIEKGSKSIERFNANKIAQRTLDVYHDLRS
jgi:glycosyltransferase involved in cell wall biosynthesis